MKFGLILVQIKDNVRKEKSKILVFYSEGCSYVILITKQARQLIALLGETVKE